MARLESLYDDLSVAATLDMDRKMMDYFDMPKKEGKIMRKADEMRPVKLPSVALGYGAKQSVKVQPKMETFEAMLFMPLTGITEIVTWLGRDFCALTDGRTPVVIAGQQIQMDGSPDDSPWANMLLVVRNERRKSLVVVTPGQWIMKDPVLGYHVFEDNVIRKLYDFVDDIDAQAAVKQ